MPDKSISKFNFHTVEQVSAGGVVFRKTDSDYEIAIISVNPSRRWQLPKGIVDAGESAEIAALREVREETGIEADLIEPIERIEYWYFGNRNDERVRFHKFVHFFLMKYIAGDVANHDHEVAEARWVNMDKAIEMLEFKDEKQIAEKAKDLIINYQEK